MLGLKLPYLFYSLLNLSSLSVFALIKQIWSSFWELEYFLTFPSRNFDREADRSGILLQEFRVVSFF